MIFAERYGHFTYAFPVDTRDRYTVVLHFAELFFGTAESGESGGAGLRDASLSPRPRFFIKAGLFLTSGILLHRLRAIGERSLFGKGKNLTWIAILWFSGALGLAAHHLFCS